MKSFLKKIFLGIIVIVILTIGLFSMFFSRFYGKTFIPQKLTADASNPTISLSKPFNVLLLGYGGGNHDGAYLTDSMMVVHNDPKSRTLYLISIPRDIWVQIPTNSNKGTYWKINAAYELGMDDQDYPNKPVQFKGVTGGASMAKYIVSQVTGLAIDRMIGMDFDGFKKTIDSLGGVDINVETTFDDYEYPKEGAENDACGLSQKELDLDASSAAILQMQPGKRTVWVRGDSSIATTVADFACRFEHIHFDQGVNHMDGDTALKYVRSRHSLQDGTDFGRSKRQRNLLSAVRQKVFSIHAIPSILPLLNSIQDDFKTDFSLTEIQLLIPELNNLQKYSIQNIALTDQNVLMDSTSDDGQFILIPKDGTGSWDGIHTFLQSSLNSPLAQTHQENQKSNSNVTDSSPIIKVKNGTHQVGLASLAVNRLKDKDFNALPPFNADNQTYENTVIYTDGSNIDPHILDELKSEFGTTQISNKDLASENCNILIIIGNNYNVLQGKKLINE